MAMNKTVLATAIVNKIKARNADADIALLTPYWEDIADAIIEHIKTNAVVNSMVAVTSVSGVTTGPGVSGPGTGTALGAIE